MNRREAIAALTALPGVAEIKVADLRPDDVIVVECESHLSAEGIANLRTSLERIWPGRKFAICEPGLHIKVVRSYDPL
jgi:hypothetical protein